MACCAAVAAAPASGSALAQAPGDRIGDAVPRDVREMYDRGLKFLLKDQADNGEWHGQGQSGPGVTGMAVMVLLASGEDPNFGLYSGQIRRALRSIIRGQDPNTGYLGNSMYHHGFGMLALAEAYGAVDDRDLWEGADAEKGRSIGQSLELAVRAALTSQKKNPFGGWRYSPDGNDADTSVSGAVLVGLLAARNAGIEVPDAAVDRAIGYFRSMTSQSGQVGYSGGFGGFDESPARISIATLVYAVARRKDLAEYQATLRHLVGELETQPNSYINYARYYQAQALFQGDVGAWSKWNAMLVRQLKSEQKADGSLEGEFGADVDTALGLLALALNYRFLPIYER
ncbi:MAG: squalene--hopene cyclase [Planctomycetes bacterium]|nr:squalene--hopene cyclase [Planctomycetota bacterium]